jgi:zinc D-Ala-D-Ala carboxypeptidase
MGFFKLSEFDCKCGCKANAMQPGFLYLLESLRARVGFPLVVTSGYRCPPYNCQVATTGDCGPHTTGRACDLLVARDAAWTLLKAAMSDGRFTGIGIAQKGVTRYIHLDNLPQAPGRPRPTLWSY